ncbi:hypothetical protein CgunFtcFv8_010837 [Champsocephalus gunnari]|uniref:Uncharacterized protein n=1 Tax=Champsocephalus gunnari TaxID=52237 RepID=A0AAN8HVH2_CHAGU|nr:hypothetical protein CgunFtcFv8_010837 [Champsocephalus gunnari]
MCILRSATGLPPETEGETVQLPEVTVGLQQQALTPVRLKAWAPWEQLGNMQQQHSETQQTTLLQCISIYGHYILPTGASSIAGLVIYMALGCQVPQRRHFAPTPMLTLSLSNSGSHNYKAGK